MRFLIQQIISYKKLSDQSAYIQRNLNVTTVVNYVIVQCTVLCTVFTYICIPIGQRIKSIRLSTKLLTKCSCWKGPYSGWNSKTVSCIFFVFTISQLIQHRNLNILVSTPHNYQGQEFSRFDAVCEIKKTKIFERCFSCSTLLISIEHKKRNDKYLIVTL